MPCVDGVDEVSGGVIDCGFGDEFLVADGDDDRSQWLKGLDDLLDRCPGLVLMVASYGESGKDHREVRFDRVTRAVEDGTCLQIRLGHAKGLLDLPQVVIRRHDGMTVHRGWVDVGDVPLVAGRLTCSFDERLVQGDGLAGDFDEPLLLEAERRWLQGRLATPWLKLLQSHSVG